MRKSSTKNILKKESQNHLGRGAVSKAVRIAIASNQLFEPWYDACTPSNPQKCGLATGLEGLFVTEIAARFYRAVWSRTKGLKFNQVIYMPSTYIEKKCGFDLSLGDFRTLKRFRLMHKIVLKWCDQEWSWPSRSKAEAARSARHIGMLVDQYRRSRGKIRPFLSVNVCFCLHEYRRQGNPTIPAFEDKRRTLFIDLSSLKNALPRNCGNTPTEGQLLLRHRLDESGRSEFECSWEARTKTALKVLDWAAFTAAAKRFFHPQAPIVVKKPIV